MDSFYCSAIAEYQILQFLIIEAMVRTPQAETALMKKKEHCIRLRIVCSGIMAAKEVYGKKYLLYLIQ